MPLSSRIGKSEPKKKKAKVSTTKQKSSTKGATNGIGSPNGDTLDSTENEESNNSSILTAKTDDTSKISNGTANKNITNGDVGSSRTPAVAATAAIKTPSKAKKINSTNSNISMASTVGFASINEESMMTDMSNQTSEQVSTLGATNSKFFEPIKPIVRDYKPGYILSVGENLSNQLGHGCDVDDRKKPQIIKDLPINIVQIAAGGMHSACLTQDGLVYTFGCNDEFALGRENDEEIAIVDLPEKSIEITAGDSHTAALSETGIVYAWGTFRDGSGVLGLEQKKIAKTPMKFRLRDKIVKISSGADHLVFLTANGEVYTAGNSEHGQLGRISKYNSCRGGRRGCDMILVPGLVRFGKRKELQGHRQIEDIWTSAYCTFLKVKDSDLVIGFGLNNCFQLGIEDAENRYQPDILYSLKFEGAKLRKVCGGMHHTMFLDTLGNVYALGSHRYGGLGVGEIKEDAKAPIRIETLKDVVEIAANTNVSYAITKDGKVFSWGTNYSKQIGQDTEDDYFVPTPLNSRQLDKRDAYSVSVGGQHALFIAGEEKTIEED